MASHPPPDGTPMNEHLPECCIGNDDDYLNSSMVDECICDALRDCEARVLREAMRTAHHGDDSALGARRTLNQGRAAPTGRMTMSTLPPEGAT